MTNRIKRSVSNKRSSRHEKIARSKLALAAKLRLEPKSVKTVNAYFGLIQRRKASNMDTAQKVPFVESTPKRKPVNDVKNSRKGPGLFVKPTAAQIMKFVRDKQTMQRMKRKRTREKIKNLKEKNSQSLSDTSIKSFVPDKRNGNTPTENITAEANATPQSTTSMKGVIRIQRRGLMIPGVMQ